MELTVAGVTWAQNPDTTLLRVISTTGLNVHLNRFTLIFADDHPSTSKAHAHDQIPPSVSMYHTGCITWISRRGTQRGGW